MSGEVVQFVDSVNASATVRLDLNTAPWLTLNAGTDVSPPPMARAVADTLMADGAAVQFSSYSNRVITLHLACDATSATQKATEVQKLNRELDRETNYLRWQPEPLTPAVYFKVYRSPDYAHQPDYGLDRDDMTVSMVADPFAMGLPQTITTATVNNDPASGSNPKYMDITGVIGDVAAPLIVKIPGTAVNNYKSLLAMRRRGTPSAMPYIQQAESMTLSTDTAVAANNANYSGASSNSITTTFATVTTLAQRASFNWPPSASVDARGLYRVFGRFNSSATSTYTLGLRYGVRSVANTTVTVASAFAAISMVDLGLIQIPVGVDPATDGPSGTDLSVSASSVNIRLYASRDSGTGSLTCDYLMFVPADDRLAIIQWGDASTVTTYVFDAEKAAVYGLDAGGAVTDVASGAFVGMGALSVTPNRTNRLFFIRDTTLQTIPSTVPVDAVTGSAALSLSYYPRYLTVRPTST